jgi:hypothetical protein
MQIIFVVLFGLLAAHIIKNDYESQSNDSTTESIDSFPTNNTDFQSSQLLLLPKTLENVDENKSVNDIKIKNFNSSNETLETHEAIINLFLVCFVGLIGVAALVCPVVLVLNTCGA